MKYSFALERRVREFVEWQLEHYHEDKKQLEQYKNDMIPSAVTHLSLTAGTSHGSVSMPTEQTALRIATSPYIMETEKCIKAVESVINGCDAINVKLIELIYWQKAYTVVGAGLKVGLSQAQAYRHVNNILCRVALEMGYVSI
jgi:RinA family phage transcriptional activator